MYALVECAERDRLMRQLALERFKWSLNRLREGRGREAVDVSAAAYCAMPTTRVWAGHEAVKLAAAAPEPWAQQGVELVARAKDRFQPVARRVDAGRSVGGGHMPSTWRAWRARLGPAVMRVVQRLPLRTKRHVLFAIFQHRWGNFDDPRSFSEKVNWRMLHDRRPDLAWTCDKLEMKARAAAVGVHSPDTYWQGVDVAGLAEVRLPPQWVLKPNHRTGLIYFGKGDPDVGDLRRVTAGWLDERQADGMGEWAYSQARALLLVEEQLEPTGTPIDYKFFVTSGLVQVLTLDLDRFGDHRRVFYTPDWQLVDAQCG